MEIWKKNIFVSAILFQMQTEQKSAQELVERYGKLTQEEKTEILKEIEKYD